jgi:lipoate-protein ligase A
VKSGVIIESHISTAADIGTANLQARRIHTSLSNRKLHEISEWGDVLALIGETDSAADVRNVANWLNKRLGH